MSLRQLLLGLVLWLGLVLLESPGTCFADRVEDFFDDYMDWKNGGKQFIEVAKTNRDIRRMAE